MSDKQGASDHLSHDQERGGATEPIHPEAGLKTSDFYKTESLPERFNHPDWFVGYGTQPQNPFFRTTAMSYGKMERREIEMQKNFHERMSPFGSPQKLGKVGMYRNHSLNTAVDRSRV